VLETNSTKSLMVCSSFDYIKNKEEVASTVLLKAFLLMWGLVSRGAEIVTLKSTGLTRVAAWFIRVWSGLRIKVVSEGG
jgi:hypothetical protein